MAGSSNGGGKDGFAVAIEGIYLERAGVSRGLDGMGWRRENGRMGMAMGEMEMQS